MSSPPVRPQPPAGECSLRLELSELYRRHGRALRQRARALLGGPDEAEDVLQEVFLAMVASPGLHRGEASVFTLLYQMVTHKALDRCRARARRQDRLTRLGCDEAGAGGGLGSIEAARDLQRMARSESPRALTAALLHFVEGHTQGEVAQVLGVSRKTVVRMLGQLSARVRC
ncbi:RNA polymerase sigma factor [Pyxidicoccus sp. 3LG]